MKYNRISKYKIKKLLEEERKELGEFELDESYFEARVFPKIVAIQEKNF